MNDSETRDQFVAAIDAWLPQTQCTRCGYPRCLDYARALADGEADLNQCPPGGETTIQGLAGLLGREPKPLDPAYGEPRAKTVVRIDEPRCIGCTLCIQACPVDAIVGAATRMHTVIESECTGCELCLAPCPVDCIEVIPAPAVDDADSPWADYSTAQTERARARTQARLERLTRRRQQRQLDRMHRRARPGSARIQTEIAAALARSRARRRPNPADPT